MSKKIVKEKCKNIGSICIKIVIAIVLIILLVICSFFIYKKFIDNNILNKFKAQGVVAVVEIHNNLESRKGWSSLLSKYFNEKMIANTFFQKNNLDTLKEDLTLILPEKSYLIVYKDNVLLAFVSADNTKDTEFSELLQNSQVVLNKKDNLNILSLYKPIEVDNFLVKEKDQNIASFMKPFIYNSSSLFSYQTLDEFNDLGLMKIFAENMSLPVYSILSQKFFDNLKMITGEVIFYDNGVLKNQIEIVTTPGYLKKLSQKTSFDKKLFKNVKGDEDLFIGYFYSNDLFKNISNFISDNFGKNYAENFDIFIRDFFVNNLFISIDNKEIIPSTSLTISKTGNSWKADIVKQKEWDPKNLFENIFNNLKDKLLVEEVDEILPDKTKGTFLKTNSDKIKMVDITETGGTFSGITLDENPLIYYLPLEKEVLISNTGTLLISSEESNIKNEYKEIIDKLSDKNLGVILFKNKGSLNNLVSSIQNFLIEDILKPDTINYWGIGYQIFDDRIGFEIVFK